MRPIADSTGRARSKASAVPPHMIASVPSRAPSTPPLTGQSRNAAPRPARRVAASRAVDAATVEQSMTMSPGRAPGMSASTTPSTSASAETQSTIASQLAASAAGSAATAQPVSAASASALGLPRFQAPVRRPALCRLRAMDSPMAPSPMNPVFTRSPADGARRARCA